MNSKVAVFGAAVLSAASVHAPLAHAQAPQWCEGNVARVLTMRDGIVLVLPSFRNEWIQVCNLLTTWKDVPASMCNIWIATLTTAAAAQRQITVNYSDAPACSQLPSYGGAPGPVYISLIGS